MASVRRSLAISLTERYLITGVQLVSTMVLARLLSPHDIGVYSVATVFMGFIQVFRDAGVSQYIIQEKDLDKAKFRAAFGAVLLTSWLLAPLVWLLAGPVARFYGEPGLVDILHVLAVNLLLIPFGATLMGYLARQMAFGRLLVVRLASTLVQVATGITLAWQGHGFMSLAWASLAGVVTTVLVLNVFRPAALCQWPSLGGLKPVLQFGSQAAGISLLKEFSNGLPELILGRTLGMAPLGLYSRAVGQVQIFNRLFLGALISVGTPHFARLHRQQQPLGPAYRHASAAILGIAWPLFGCMALLAQPLVLLLYGPQWGGSAELVPVLCLNVCLALALPLSEQLLIATGRVNLALRQTLLRTALLAAVLITLSPLGLKAVVWGGTATGLVMATWRYVTLRGWAVQGAALCAEAGRAACVTALAVAGPAAAVLALPESSAFVVVLAAGMLALPGWLAGLVLTRHPLAAEIANACRRVAPRIPVAWLQRRMAVDD